MIISKGIRINKLTLKNFLILITIISILKCILLYLLIKLTVLYPHPIIGYLPDSGIVETIAKNIISGHGFSSDTQGPFHPTMFKEPVYPLLIALIYFVFGQKIQYIIVLQILLSAFIAILIYFIGKEVFREEIARFSAILISIIPIFGEVSLFIQTEGFCIPLTLLCLYIIIKAFKKNLLIYYIFAGILLAILSLCRNISLLLWLIFLFLIVLGYGKGLRFNLRESMYSRFTRALFFTLGFVSVVSPWILRNIIKFNSYQIRTTGGQAMYAQAIMAETFSQRELKAYLTYLVSGRLAHKYFPDFIGDNLGDFDYRYQRNLPGSHLIYEGLTEGQMDLYWTKEAIKKIFSHPIKYFYFSTLIYIPQVLKYFIPWSITFCNGKNPILTEVIFPIIRFLFGFPMGLPFTFMAISGLFFSKKKKIIKYLPIIIFICYFHFVLFFFNSGIFGITRMLLPVIPLYAFFVCIFFFKISKIKKDNQVNTSISNV